MRSGSQIPTSDYSPLNYLNLAGDFNKYTFEAELQCGNRTCLDMSIAESSICKPLIKSSEEMNPVLLVLLIINVLSISLMVCFDLLFVRMSRSGQTKPTKPLSTLLFVVLSAATIIYLSSDSFDKKKFCSMNIKEKICAHQESYRHEGAFHTKDKPIYVSAPHRIFPVGNSGSRDFDILSIDETVSPCTLELRTKFFIENFQMSASVSPNNFVLLDGEMMKFTSFLDFHAMSKQGSATLDRKYNSDKTLT